MKNFNKTLAVVLFAAASLFSAQSANAQSTITFDEDEYEPELTVGINDYKDTPVDIDELLAASGAKRIQTKQGNEYERFVLIMRSLKYYKTNHIEMDGTVMWMASKRLRSMGCSDSFVRAIVFGKQWLWS